ncbi:DUF2254 domain-containing protein [Litchfieldia salsa]|nr:DUF2254 domain-containing protein [Litchfieldia salsa]
MINKMILRIKNSIWLIPSLYAFIAFALAVVVIFIDMYLLNDSDSVLPRILLVNVNLAQEMLSTIAGSLLTMTTITFSTIMVVLTTYSSQFSPRTLQNFIRDPVTMRVLGVFIGGFVYSIFSLLFMREGSVDNFVVAASIGVLIALVCVVVFAYFIHHVASSVQVSRLIEQLAKDVLETIGEKVNHIKNNDRISILDVPPPAPVELSERTTFCNDKFGYIQLINEDVLSKEAIQQGYYIKVEYPIGSFLSKNKKLITIAHSKDVQPKRLNEITLGHERTTDQDIGFGLQKLSEIALRAISPGINDPNTAIECIRHLGICLKGASKIDAHYIAFYNEDNRISLVIPQRPFEELLRSSFYQICHYGQRDISILAAVFDALWEIADSNTEDIQEKTVEFSRFVLAKVDSSSLTSYDKENLKNQMKRLEELIE